MAKVALNNQVSELKALVKLVKQNLEGELAVSKKKNEELELLNH